MEKITFCISTYNNLNYLKLAIKSVRKYSFFKTAPFIVHAENCNDGTNEWLEDNKYKYNLEIYIEDNKVPVGIGGGMNFCAEKVKTEFIMFLHSDFFVSENWDLNCLNIFDKHGQNEKIWVFPHRIEPNMFNVESRPGTLIVEKNIFGDMFYNFNEDEFISYAKKFIEINKNYAINKSEGVSGLIRKKDWDFIGGNDPIFSPTSYEDLDLFLRMLQQKYKFILTGNSVVWHFGARGSHRLEENNFMSSERQKNSEINNQKKWIKKWGKLPEFDVYGNIKNNITNDFLNIPFVITNRDRMYSLIEQVKKIKYLGYHNITIIDNQSTYGPLLEWYSNNEKIFDIFYNKIINSNFAFGELIKLNHSKFVNIFKNWYISNDSDIVLSEDTPHNFVEIMYNISKKLNIPKVGASIIINDIDLSYNLNKMCYDYEKTYWTNEIYIPEYNMYVYPHPIDTTFSLHAPNTLPGWSNNTVRTGYPIQVKHLPFYYDPNDLPSDELHYIKNMEKKYSNWSSKVKID